ncbi:M20/M25/M40 family metallo-hydrolase [Effusibacillus pohliae]|uniref:M20/M25/M40 family metallo-hydrolase n=1 Tax=Effusibacillus pohliae TaxID=232270 RepID=UPI00037B0FAA|nr:M20/M25/M40 family metallo-hydrolase [Effusibacillus pohliae]
MVTVNRDRLIQEFMELVQIDSHSREERQMADALIAKLKPYGCEVYEDDTGEKVGGNAGNLIFRVKGDADKPTILFTCHMDTVQPGKGIKPQVHEDRITSDGSTVLGADDKAGVAAILEMVRVLKEQQLPHGNLVLLFTIGEEIGLLGSRHLNGELLKDVDYGFAFDSNGPIGKIVTQGPSQAKLEVVIHGKTAHAGVNPEAGISAIKLASMAISRMKLGRIDAETTANIGMINGGVATNIVPERVEIVAEARSLVPSKLDAQLEHMKTTFEQVAAENGGRAEVKITRMYPAFRFGDDDQVVQIAKRAAQAIGVEPSTMSSGGGSDANNLNGLGVPTINIAIGYEKIHTVDEFIRLDDLEQAARFMVAITQQV